MCSPPRWGTILRTVSQSKFPFLPYGVFSRHFVTVTIINAAVCATPSEALCFWPIACLEREQRESQTRKEVFNQFPDSFELQHKSPQGVLQIYSGGCWEKLSEIIQTREAVYRTACVCQPGPGPCQADTAMRHNWGLKSFASFSLS